MREIYSCLEDYDLAIDDFILESQTFPVIQEDTTGTCPYCQMPSAYRLTAMPGGMVPPPQEMQDEKEIDG